MKLSPFGKGVVVFPHDQLPNDTNQIYPILHLPFLLSFLTVLFAVMISNGLSPTTTTTFFSLPSLIDPLNIFVYIKSRPTDIADKFPAYL